MKKVFLMAGICLVAVRLWAYTYVDTSQIPYLPVQGIMGTVADLEQYIDKNGKNYPDAFVMANAGGYAVGKATLGSFPHFFIGVSGTLGCANMKYYDENVARQEKVYPAYSPNFNIILGFGLAKGFDIMGKFMLFNDILFAPFGLDKFQIASAGVRARYNIISKKELMPRIFDFAGLTFSFGFDYMEGSIGDNQKIKYQLKGVSLSSTPTSAVPGNYTVKLYSSCTVNLDWYMLSQHAHLHAYFDFLWIFTFYTGIGYSLNYGFIKLEGTGMALATLIDYTNLGTLWIKSHNRFIPRLFAGIFTAGFEVNVFFVKVALETQVNISNGRDINLQASTRFQF